MFKNLSYSAFLLIVLGSSLSAGLIRDFLPELGENFIYQARAPFTISLKQGIGLSAGTTLTYGLISEVDVPLEDEIRTLRLANPWMSDISPYISELGGTVGLLSIGGIACFGWLTDRYKEQETAYLMAQAAITSGVWCRIGKTVSARTRPSAAWNGEKYDDHWHTPFSQLRPESGAGSQYDAFPSGHTTSFVSMITVVACQYAEDKVWIPPVLGVATSIFATARMVEETHWISDCFVGAALGYLCGRQVVKHHTIRNGSSSERINKSRLIMFPISSGVMVLYAHNIR